ncbi:MULTISPECIES: hypothetical protein [Ralstonia]|jgi:hypothetical protein|uniref:Uncharacterized protein n=2 Tax=Ralstonia pickettii TaxID=329 RepID=R0DXB8_RALPI|nr:hypothetical protein [Ralstonia pickettii]ENZ78068.1 hypothetical protein OR214_02344 [Ralstonia pickettii OR214]MCM3581844.1 hypothetical protein [Ralstonia pickettii]
MGVTQTRAEVPEGLTPAQLAHLARVELRSRQAGGEMAQYLAEGADVVVYRQDECREAPPFAIGVVGTDFWIDCCDSREEAFTVAESLGLKVKK